MPLGEAIGMLFHSDYEDWKQEDVLGWQRYELFCGRTMATKGTGRAKRKHAPQGYPYTECGPTTLFSGVQWVLQDYLQRPGTHQVTIFTSTFFSVWELLMNTSKYSRGKPIIRQVYLEKMLSCKDMLKVIKTIEERRIDGNEHKAVSSTMSMWCGQPGFFFDRFLPYFQAMPRNTPLIDRIEKAHKEAETDLVETIFTDALESLRETKSIKLEATSVAVTGDELVHFLCHCHRLRGGNINCLSSAMAKLVSAGFAIVRDYVPGESKRSAGVVIEPLVTKFLDGLANETGSRARQGRPY